MGSRADSRVCACVPVPSRLVCLSVCPTPPVLPALWAVVLFVLYRGQPGDNPFEQGWTGPPDLDVIFVRGEWYVTETDQKRNRRKWVAFLAISVVEPSSSE